MGVTRYASLLCFRLLHIAYDIIGDVLVCGLIIVMVVIKGINFFAGKISRRIRYYTAPFVTVCINVVVGSLTQVLLHRQHTQPCGVSSIAIL